MTKKELIKEIEWENTLREIYKRKYKQGRELVGDLSGRSPEEKLAELIESSRRREEARRQELLNKRWIPFRKVI